MSSDANRVPEEPPELTLIGRVQERARLRGWLSDALRGRGRLVLVGGEAGIGKSTLVDWAADVARQAGALVLAGGCYDLSITPPLGPWIDALAGQPSPLLVAADHQMLGSQAALFEQVRAYLTDLASERFVAVLLEDLHWSDPASLELLRYLARRIDTVPVLLLVTYRTDAVTRHNRFFQTLPMLVREARAERLDLMPLDEVEVQALVARFADLDESDQRRVTGYLLARAGGNPFYLTEVLRTLVAERLLRSASEGGLTSDLERSPVPLLVQQVVEQRLAALDATSLRLLEAAAVIGNEVPLELWKQATGATLDALDDAVARAAESFLLTEQSDTPRVAFRHALVREALYARQERRDRQERHRRVAESLLTQPDPLPTRSSR